MNFQSFCKLEFVNCKFPCYPMFMKKSLLNHISFLPRYILISLYHLFLCYFIILLVLSISEGFFPYSLHAEDQNLSVFSLSNQTQYSVNEKGETNVTQQVTFRNVTNEYYVPNYEITTDTDQILNLQIWDEKQTPVTFETSTLDNQVKIKFNLQEVIGPQKSYHWTMSYQAPEVVSQNGAMTEITIPQIVSLKDYENYQLELSVAKKLGQKSFISPSPKTETETDISYVYTFDKESLLKNSVSAAFGAYQLFNFTLKYHLENTENDKVYTEIPLPSDKSNQQVFLEMISPPPQKTYFDGDRNVLGYYELEPKQKVSITVSGYAKVWLLQSDLTQSGKLSDIPQDIVTSYTSNLPYWEASDLEIRTLAESLTQDQETVAQKAQAIFDYVSQNLIYNDNRLQENPSRLGAKKALENKDQAVCMEYTDLYIALARSVGIPARELDGYAYNAKQNIGYIDSLHAWVEVYIPPFGWLPIDPTWSSTASSLDYFNKLDTNHLVFVTKGLSSEIPYPPGSYKSNEKEGDILVDFTNEEQKVESHIQITLENTTISGEANTNDYRLAGLFPKPFKLQIVNNGPFTLYQGQLQLKSDYFQIKSSELNNLEITPYGVQEVTVNITNPNILKFGSNQIALTFTTKDLSGQLFSQAQTQTLKYSPFLWNLLPIGIGIGGGIFIVAGIFGLSTFHDHKPTKVKHKKRSTK